MDKVVEFFKKIWNEIKEFFKKLFSKIKEIFNKIKEKHILKKLKVSITKFFGYIGSCIGGFITKKKNINVSEELKIIDKKIDKIEKNYEKETEVVVIKMYKKEITKTIKKLDKFENISTRDEEKQIKEKKNELEKLKEKIINYENKLKDIEIIDKEEKPNIKEKSKKAGEVVLNGSKKTTKVIVSGSKKVGNAIKKGSIKGGIVLKKGAIKTGKVIKKGGTKVALFTASTTSKISNNIKKKKAIKLEYKDLKDTVKEINNKINRAYNEISRVKNSYSDTKLEELLFLKEKVLDLKEDYIRLRSNKKFKQLKLDKKIDSIDPNHLSHHGNAIYDLIDYLESTINEIKDGKLKPVENKEIKREVKNLREEKQEIKELPIESVDFELVRKSLKKDIDLSQTEVSKIRKEVSDIPIKYKKTTLLSRITNFFKLSMNTAISLIPFGIFKNKLVATLTSGIILNNRVKSMKSMINNKEVPFLDYETIIDSIKDKKSCILNTGYVLTNTIDDIDELSSKLLKEYTDNPEALKLVKNLEEMKIDLIEENNKIDKMLQELKESQNKIKKKVA